MGGLGRPEIPDRVPGLRASFWPGSWHVQALGGEPAGAQGEVPGFFGRACPARPQPALPAIGRVVTGCSALANWRRCQPRALRSPRSYYPMFQPVGIWGGSLGAAFPRAMVTVWKKVCRHRHAVAGLEVGPAQVFRGHAFSIPGTSRALRSSDDAGPDDPGRHSTDGPPGHRPAGPRRARGL